MALSKSSLDELYLLEDLFVLEDVWVGPGEIFGDKEVCAVFLELSSCLFAASFSRCSAADEVETVDL